ncbi:MAG TPA: hypothetical protein VF848_12020 [Steroidobacteraceae bacterium]
MSQIPQRITYWIAVTFVALASRGAAASPPEPPPIGTEASIPFAEHRIYTWEADGDKGLWVQTTDRKWYYGKFMSPCFGLQFREGLRFKFGPSGELDHWGEILRVNHTNCSFSSFVTSLGPPRPQKPAPAAPPQTTQPAQPAVAPAPG